MASCELAIQVLTNLRAKTATLPESSNLLVSVCEQPPDLLNLLNSGGLASSDWERNALLSCETVQFYAAPYTDDDDDLTIKD